MNKIRYDKLKKLQRKTFKNRETFEKEKQKVLKDFEKEVKEYKKAIDFLKKERWLK